MPGQLHRPHEIERATSALASVTRILQRVARFLVALRLKSPTAGDDPESVRTLAAALADFARAADEIKEALAAPEANAVPQGAAEPPTTSADAGSPTPLATLATSLASGLGPCVLRGHSPQIPLPTVLELLAGNRRTGTLRVCTPDETFTLLFFDGLVVQAASDANLIDERIATILMRRGALSAEQLQGFLDRQRGARGLLGLMLCHEGLIGEDELRAGLEEQTRLLFRRLIAHPTASFFFHATDVEPTPIHVAMNIMQLLLETARTSDEAVLAPGLAWEEWLK